MSYVEYKINLSEGQKHKLAKSYRDKCPYTLRLKYEDLNGTFPILLTQTQINKIDRAKQNKSGLEIKISREQMRSQGGFLNTLIPFITKLAPKILAPLGVGALSGLASTGVSKILGNGMVSVARNKRNKILPFITPQQRKQLMNDGVIKLNNKQRQDGGFLGMLAASLGIPLITSLLSGKGLQVDAQRVPYRRIPRVKKK